VVLRVLLCAQAHISPLAKMPTGPRRLVLAAGPAALTCETTRYQRCAVAAPLRLPLRWRRAHRAHVNYAHRGD